MPARCLLCLLGLSLSVLPGCQLTQKLTKDPEIAQLNKRRFLNAALDKAPAYNTLAIRGKGYFKQGDQRQKFSYRINLKRDSLIWASMTAFGIEGIRAIIRQDSAYVVNNLKNTYYKTDLGIIEQYAGFSLDFTTLQGLFIGSPHIAQAAQPLQAKEARWREKQGKAYELFRERRGGYDFQYFFNDTTGQLTYIDAQAQHRKRRSLIFYGDYQVVDEQGFPYLAKMAFEGRQPMKVELEHKQIEVDPERINFRFTIPEDYVRSQP
jgi:hypothetical protein